MTATSPIFARKSTSAVTAGPGTVRYVSHELIIGGIHVHGFIEWSRDELSYCAGSTASATFRMFGLGLPTWLGQQVPANIEWSEVSQKLPIIPFVIKTKLIVNGTDTGWAEDFSGIVDTIESNPDEGTYTVNASSYARILVNKKISETIAGTANANKTTGQVIQDMTAKYGQGLKTHIAPSMFTTKVGKVYKTQMVKTILNMPIWDLFQSFAQRDHADLFVRGDTLYYVPKPGDANSDVTELGPVAPSYTFTYGVDILKVKVTHAALFSHDVQVTVRSYQPRTQQTYESTKNMSDLHDNAIAAQLETSAGRDDLATMNAASQAKLRPHKGRDQVKATAQAARIGHKDNYTFVVPNATQEDCDQIALRIAEDIARKEFLVELTVPARTDFNTRQYFRLTKLPSAVQNQVYAPKSIRISSGVSEGAQAQGYLATLTLVNHAVQTTGASLGV